MGISSLRRLAVVYFSLLQYIFHMRNVLNIALDFYGQWSINFLVYVVKIYSYVG